MMITASFSLFRTECIFWW